ncbi:MAG: DUF5668 domain-containing protein [Coriobacteriia bacterium]|jgi:hypothetical protein|nr:DUF5668 domain-containing protein [Coriobacteriia bacterium]
MIVKRILEGLTLVLVGVILLLNTMGSLPWSVWLHIISLWPLLLVAAGLDIIAKGVGAEWLRVVSSLLIIAGLIFGAFVLPIGDTASGTNWLWGHKGAQFDVAEVADPHVRAGEAIIQGGVGSYRIGAGDDLVRVWGRSPYGAPGVSAKTASGHASVTVTGPESGRVWVPGVRGASRVNVALSDEILWDLQIDTGVVDLDADLSDLALNSVEVRSGVSQVTMDLGDIPKGVEEVRVVVRGGVANFTVRVPEGVPVRVDAEAGLANIDVADDIPRASDASRIWMTPGYPGPGGYRIRFEAGVSNVRVATY